MKIRFLLDENLSPKFKSAILRLNPQIDIMRVGEVSMPPLGTLDPEILIYLEMSKRLLVTDNRKSMPAHLEEHWSSGGHIWGLFWLRPNLTLSKAAEELNLVWEASEAEEWVDKISWIPF